MKRSYRGWVGVIARSHIKDPDFEPVTRTEKEEKDRERDTGEVFKSTFSQAPQTTPTQKRLKAYIPFG